MVSALGKNVRLLCVLSLFYAAKGAYVPSAVNVSDANISLSFAPGSLSLRLRDKGYFYLTLSKALNASFTIEFWEDGVNAVELPWKKHAFGYGTTQVEVPVTAERVGHVIVTATVSAEYVDTRNTYISIQVYRSSLVDLVSKVVGWAYFAFWTLSFYPQIYENYKRKSVVGLNFDYLLFNFVGHLSYNLFNIGLFWIPSIQKEYFIRHPHGVNPVQANDVGFSMHAVFAVALTILQAFAYERGDQRISFTCKCLFAGILAFLITSLFLSVFHVITWLDYLYYFSYLKLLITLLKCCPQAYLNYKRKSTVGWSIESVLLDFCGGYLSIVQMFLIAYNFNDWSSIFGDPTKFGLGLFSVMFNTLFTVQHYILYRRRPYALLEPDAKGGKYGSLGEAINVKKIVR